MRCISPKELAMYLMGEVTRSQAEGMEEHLSSCGACSQELESLLEMVGRIRKPTEQMEEKDHLSEVRRRIERGDGAYQQRLRRWPLIAGAGLVIVALAVAGFFLLQPSDADDKFRVKGDEPPILEQDRWVGIQAFSVGDSGAPASLKDMIRKSDYLIFTYTNLGDRPFDYMAIFAVDEASKVYWFHPAYTQDGEDPVSIKISEDAEGVELREKIRHDFPEGRLWIYGLFTNEPLNVSTVEQMAKSAARGQRIPLKGSAQHILVTEVRP